MDTESKLLSDLESSSLSADCVDGACSIQLPATFTVVEAVTFQKFCQDLFHQQSETQKLVLDFSQTTFIDSSGIGSLVICRRLCKQRNVELLLQHVGPQVMLVLTMTDLDKIFTISQQDPNAIPPVTTSQDQRVQPTHPSVRSPAKRVMDLVGGVIGLGLTAILFIPIAIAIKLEDGGPIFFSQIRCSWMGKRFRIWKFRSMVVDAEALKARVKNEVEGPLFKNEHDPRITRIGGFLRKTSLDEFPQFWNVLKGDMSLVGTRPPTPDEIEHYEVPAWQRLNVKPGLTGEWQVNGRSSIKKFEDVIQLDLRYQQNWSLLYDLHLILKTVLVIFTRESGAS